MLAPEQPRLPEERDEQAGAGEDGEAGLLQLAVAESAAAGRAEEAAKSPAPALLRVLLILFGALAIVAVAAAAFHVLGARPGPGELAELRSGEECQKLLQSPTRGGRSSPLRLQARQPSSQSQSSSAGTRSPAATPGAPPRALAHEECYDLCPTMVVPNGTDFIFAVREVLARERQQLSFSIVDAEGKPLRPRPLFVSVRELESPCGISLQMDDASPLAWVHTEPLHLRRGGPPEIRRPGGQVFCTVVKEDASEAGSKSGYALRSTSGLRLCTLSGDFKEKAVNVADPLGRLVCATERRVIDSLQYYQVRVGPRVDAGLVLCGLLAIDKLEGSAGARAGGA